MCIYFRNILSILPFLLGALTGCSNETPADPGGNQNPVTTTPPGVGSTFIFRSYETSLQGKFIDTSEVFDTSTVVQGGIAIRGKTGTMAMKGRTDTSTIYLHYGSNGDFAMLPTRDPHWPLEWVIFPIATKGKSGLPTLREVGSHTTYVRRDSFYYEGMEDLTIGSTTYSCHKIRNIRTHDHEGEDTRTQYTSYWWYAPSARMFVKSETLYEAYYVSTGSRFFRRGLWHTELIGYTLK